MWGKYGWQALEADEKKTALTHFARWSSQELLNPPGRLVDAGVPQTTWNVKRLFRLSETIADELEQDLVSHLTDALRSIVSEDHSLLAFGTNQQPFRFFPHRGEPNAFRNFWASEVLPHDKDYAIVTNDWRQGIFASYLSGTLTVFGEPLLSAVISSHASLLDSPIRRIIRSQDTWRARMELWNVNGWSILEPKIAGPILARVSEFTSDLDLSPLEPSLTWNISSLTDGESAEPDPRELDLLSKLAIAIYECSVNCCEWYALCYPYPACVFSAQAGFDSTDYDQWAIPIVSRYANSCYIRSDFQAGILCLNRMGQLVIFGRDLLSQISRLSPLVLDKLVASR
jgi:hypothetical protein